MGLFSRKKKIKVEEIVSQLIENTLPKSVQYYHNESRRIPSPLSIPDQKLLNIGAGMCLFFLSEIVTAEDQKVTERAYKQMEKQLESIQGNAREAHRWWKAFTDGRIFQENENPARIAAQIVWDKFESSTPYREPSPIRSYGYFLKVEIDTYKDHKFV